MPIPKSPIKNSRHSKVSSPRSLKRTDLGTFVALCIVRVVSDLIVPAQTHAATFGDQSGYGTNAAIKDAVHALAASPTESGVRDSVTVYLKLSFDSCKAKCALYTIAGNDTVLVTNGTTEERRFATNGSFTWQGFAFPSPKPTVTAGATYFIAAFGDTAGAESGGLARVAVNTTGSGAVVRRDVNYESGFPNPLNPSTSILNYNMSAYVTYTPTSAAAPPRRRRVLIP